MSLDWLHLLDCPTVPVVMQVKNPGPYASNIKGPLIIVLVLPTYLIVLPTGRRYRTGLRNAGGRPG